MNWPTIYAALSSVAQLSGIGDPLGISWSTMPDNSAWQFGPNVTMKIKTVNAIGIDFEIFTYQAPLNQAVQVVGNRQFIWSIRIDSQTGDPAAFALGYMDSLRARLMRTTTDQTLSAAGLAVAEIHATQEAGYMYESRMVSSYVMDVLMNAAENDTDATANAGQYIDHVLITSNKLQLPDGSNAPSQIVNMQVGP